MSMYGFLCAAQHKNSNHEEAIQGMLAVYLSLIESEREKRVFSRLYEEYYGYMFVIAKSILNDHTSIEDAVHDAFVRIARNMPSIVDLPDGNMKAYIGTTMRNCALNMRRKQAELDSVSLEEYHETRGRRDPEDDIIQSITIENVCEKLGKIGVGHKELLMLRYGMGLSTSQIAAHYDISGSSARKRLERARRAFVALIRAED